MSSSDSDDDKDKVPQVRTGGRAGSTVPGVPGGERGATRGRRGGWAPALPPWRAWDRVCRRGARATAGGARDGAGRPARCEPGARRNGRARASHGGTHAGCAAVPARGRTREGQRGVGVASRCARLARAALAPLRRAPPPCFPLTRLAARRPPAGKQDSRPRARTATMKAQRSRRPSRRPVASRRRPSRRPRRTGPLVGMCNHLPLRPPAVCCHVRAKPSAQRRWCRRARAQAKDAHAHTHIARRAHRMPFPHDPIRVDAAPCSCAYIHAATPVLRSWWQGPERNGRRWRRRGRQDWALG